ATHVQADELHVLVDDSRGDLVTRCLPEVHHLDAGLAQRARDEEDTAPVAIETRLGHEHADRPVGHHRTGASQIPKVPRYTLPISPIVASAATASSMRGTMFSVPRHPASSSRSASVAARASRVARRSSSRTMARSHASAPRAKPSIWNSHTSSVKVVTPTMSRRG